MKFDEINSLEEYFKPMRISESARRERVELAEELEDAVLLFFAYYDTLTSKGLGNREHFIEYAYNLLENATLNTTGIDEHLSKHLKNLSTEIVGTTIKHTSTDTNGTIPPYSAFPLEKSTSEPPQSKTFKTFENDDLTPFSKTNNTTSTSTSNATSGSPLPSDETNTSGDVNTDFWLSQRRAFLIAGNEANSILNYSDYAFAMFEGKTQKQWLTMEDERVRMSHAEVDSQTIGINDLFVVGDSVMRFPHDEEYGASPQEIIQCRCSCRYF